MIGTIWRAATVMTISSGLVGFAGGGSPAGPEPGAGAATGGEHRVDEVIRYGGQAAELSVARITDRTIEVQLAPLDVAGRPVPVPPSEVLVEHPRALIGSWQTLYETEFHQVGRLALEVEPFPLRVRVRGPDGRVLQELAWPDQSGSMHFRTEAPVFGLGHGGTQYDRRGHLFPMRDGWGAYERPTHGSRIAAPMLVGLDGWSIFVHHPISEDNAFDLRDGQGVFRPHGEVLQQPLRVFLTLWDEPAQALSEYRVIAGPTPMPPIWALGYMQSHRTLEGPEQMRQIAQGFRERRLPADAVIYLGTGFVPAGWNLGHGSFEFNEEIFDDPERIFRELKELNFKVVLHTYSPPRGLHGSSMEEASDHPTHIRNYWIDNHESIARLGVDGWWPDGGEALSSESRVARYRMYWQGPLHTEPNVRPWNINRTGYSGAHRYGGWIWSGDPESFWRTLETHIAVGLNHSVSLTPFWGSDTGGFRPTEELTGELFVRWLQFSTFTASFRGHGRAWHLRLPWGWNTGKVGPPEVTSTGDWDQVHARGYPREDELRNGLVEPIARQYLQLRYRLLPYNYTLMREAHDTGLPPMRAMWLHYPEDEKAVSLGDQYLWGRYLLVAPVYTQGASERTLYLPHGQWYDFWTHEAVFGGREVTRKVDLATLPVYVRAGAILPLDPVRQYTLEPVEEPTTFRVFPGRDGSYRWYRDDGMSEGYQRGDFSWTLLTWNDREGMLTVEPDPRGEGRAPDPVAIQIQLVPDEFTRMVHWDGTRTEVRFR